MSIAVIERVLPVDGTGTIFDIYMTIFKFNYRKDKSIKELPKSEKYIRGFVEDKNMPQEGGIFRMIHHRLSERLRFGALKLEHCRNIIEEEGHYYFEANDTPYILIPVVPN